MFKDILLLQTIKSDSQVSVRIQDSRDLGEVLTDVCTKLCEVIISYFPSHQAVKFVKVAAMKGSRQVAMK